MGLVERWLMGELASVLEASKVEVPKRNCITPRNTKALPVVVWVCEEHWGVCDQYEEEGRGELVAPQLLVVSRGPTPAG